MCVLRVVLTFWNLVQILCIMEAFSLEEDECSNMFITQEASNSQVMDLNSDESDQDPFDFCGLGTPVSQEKADSVPHYSDISEGDDDFESEQKR